MASFNTTAFVVVLAVALLFGSAQGGHINGGEGKNYLDNLILYLINGYKNVIVNGSECHGIPRLDPLLIPNAFINISQPLLKANGAISNVSAVGLRSLEATSVSSNLVELSLALQMDIVDIVAEGEYDINGMAALVFPIYGKGPFRVQIGGIQMGGTGAMAVQNGFLFMKNLDFNFTLGALDVRLEGLLGGGELGDVINEIINTIGITIVEKVEAFLHKTITDTLLAFINYQLDGVTLIELIGGFLPSPVINCTGQFTTPVPGSTTTPSLKRGIPIQIKHY